MSVPLQPLQRRTAPLSAMLLAWFLGLLAPALHSDEPSGAAGDDRHAECSGLFVRDHAAGFEATCAAGDACRNPWHHHHPLFQHDATQCAACSISFERPAELPCFSLVPPPPQTLVVAVCVRAAAPAERHVRALARGPPSAPSADRVGAQCS